MLMGGRVIFSVCERGKSHYCLKHMTEYDVFVVVNGKGGAVRCL